MIKYEGNIELVKMGKGRKKAILVGDNPFHGISHLSQERARARGDVLPCPEYAANLVVTSIENGANGFMFSVSESTLSILKIIRERRGIQRLALYAIVPYAYEYVRLATQLGGVSGLAKNLAKKIATSGNLRAVATGLKGILEADPIAIMRTYLIYEISRVKSSAGKKANLDTVLLHEQITDMALALDLDWLFEAYVTFLSERGINPGFNTGNLAYLLSKFKEWNIDLRKTIIAAPFNKVGFQMNPSKVECERVLASIPEPTVIAISILAAGYLKPPEAIDYIAALPKIGGVAVGVSKENHARETFKLLCKKLNTP